jgi:hypothetical protein
MPHTKTDRDSAVPAETDESIEIGSVNITHLLKVGYAKPSPATVNNDSLLGIGCTVQKQWRGC